jgi:D-sedoheptulose 7-phosphate isomerase
VRPGSAALFLKDIPSVNSIDLETHAKSALEASIAVKQELIARHLPGIVGVSQAMAKCLIEGGKILFCGNGGSAADAQHLAAELLVRLRSSVDRDPLPAIALAMDSSSMTACGNDYSFEVFYERMARALGRHGDILVGLTTSGKSSNVVRALAAAKKLNIFTIGFLGGDGGPALEYCDAAIVVPSRNTARVQEAHITIGHIVMTQVEDLLLSSGYLKDAHV